MADSENRESDERRELELTRQALQRGGAGSSLSAETIRRALNYARWPERSPFPPGYDRRI